MLQEQQATFNQQVKAEKRSEKAKEKAGPHPVVRPGGDGLKKVGKTKADRRARKTFSTSGPQEIKTRVK